MWALGVIAYELLTLQRPFDTNNMASLIHKVMSCEMDETALVRSGHPVALQRLASRHGLLSVNPQLRATAEQVLRETQPLAEPPPEAVADAATSRGGRDDGLLRRVNSAPISAKSGGD